MTNIIDGAGASTHENLSIEISPILPDVDMAATKDARYDTIENVRSTEIVMSEAVCAELCLSSLPHFFRDAVYGILPSRPWSLETKGVGIGSKFG
jgi:hypothetical protein